MNILFVCTGNTCRSPMAEALMKLHLIEEGKGAAHKVLSAGISAWQGEPISPNAIEAIAEYGMNIGDQTSILLTGELVQEADLILTMTSFQKDALIAQYPDSSSKIYSLSEYISFHSEFDTPLEASQKLYGLSDVVDPYGLPISAYRNTADQLDFYTSLLAQII